MVKVLLVYEDYNELTLVETYLKKIGFDVLGISSEFLIHDQILSFNPEILVVHGRSQKVSSFSVGQKLKEHGRYHGKVVIIVPHGVRPAPGEMIKLKMDALAEAPVDPENLIQILCRMAGIAAEPFLEKLRKARLSDPELNKKMIPFTKITKESSKSAANAQVRVRIPIADAARMERYQELIKDVHIDPKTTSHHRQEIKEAQKELKQDWNFEQLEKQDELKRQFAAALFKK